MTLTAAEHARVRREAMDARNAGQRYGRRRWAEAWDWVDASGARVEVQQREGYLLYQVILRPFHPQWARTLPDAVMAMRGNVEPFLESGALKGPTGGRLDKLREALSGR